MRTSRVALPLLTLPLILAACGDGGDAAEEAPQGPPVVTEQVQELATGELLGLDRENLTATTPWRAGTVTRSAAAAAATATQLGVEALTADSFDRLLLTFRRGTPAPGYRIGRTTGEPGTYCGEETTVEGSGILVALTPAKLRGDDGSLTMDVGDVDLGLPVATGARLVCEGGREVVWLLETAQPEVEVRVLNLVEPQRIAIDVRPGDTGPQ